MAPTPALPANPKLVYGRMTEWGQDGPLAQEVGHDINDIATSGVLGAVGRAQDPPVAPLNETSAPRSDNIMPTQGTGPIASRFPGPGDRARVPCSLLR